MSLQTAMPSRPLRRASTAHSTIISKSSCGSSGVGFPLCTFSLMQSVVLMALLVITLKSARERQGSGTIDTIRKKRSCVSSVLQSASLKQPCMLFPSISNPEQVGLTLHYAIDLFAALAHFVR